MNLIFSALLATLAGVAILIYLDASTLFLTALLLSVLALRISEKSDIIATLSGVFFALSVAPAVGVSVSEVMTLSNGFVVQAVLSFLFYLYFSIQKPSIIGRIYREAKKGVGASVSSAIAGFAAGILSAALWQSYLSI